MTTLFDEEKIMKAHDKTILEQGINMGVIDGIVKVYKKINGSVDDAVNQVMEALGYDRETATDAVKKYW